MQTLLALVSLSFTEITAGNAQLGSQDDSSETHLGASCICNDTEVAGSKIRLEEEYTGAALATRSVQQDSSDRNTKTEPKPNGQQRKGEADLKSQKSNYFLLLDDEALFNCPIQLSTQSDYAESQTLHFDACASKNDTLHEASSRVEESVEVHEATGAIVERCDAEDKMDIDWPELSSVGNMLNRRIGDHGECVGGGGQLWRHWI